MHQYLVGDLIFIDSKFSRQRYTRDRKMLGRQDVSDHLGLQLFLSGGNQVSNGGRDFRVTPGRVFAVNLAHEVEAVSDDAHVLSLILPRNLVEDRFPRLSQARGLVFPEGGMAERVFGDFLLSLRDRLQEATLEDAPVLSASVLGLLDGLLGGEDPAASQSKTGTLQALQRFIEKNLEKPDLGPGLICARFRLSRATLFRLFQPQGGVRRYIQRRRIMACFQAICSPSNLSRPIYDIAMDFGLMNPGHVSSLFRQHFGMSPSEVREAARYRLAAGLEAQPENENTAVSDVERMLRWARELGAAPTHPIRPKADPPLDGSA